MNDFEAEVKTTYEALAGRALADIEVAEIALALRQFAALLIECGRDQELRVKLGTPPQPSADPRVAENTSQNDGSPLGTRLSTETAPPTGASSRDVSLHRDPSASTASASPAGTPATDLTQPVPTGATVDGSR